MAFQLLSFSFEVSKSSPAIRDVIAKRHFPLNQLFHTIVGRLKPQNPNILKDVEKLLEESDIEAQEIESLKKKDDLHWAIVCESSIQIMEIIRSGIQINEPCICGILTPLAAAAYFGKPKSLAVLVGLGADVDAVNRRGQTALMFALMSQQSSAAVVQKLIDWRADVNKQDKAQQTALIYGLTWNGNTPKIEMLLTAGANVHIKDWQGKSFYDRRHA